MKNVLVYQIPTDETGYPLITADKAADNVNKIKDTLPKDIILIPSVYAIRIENNIIKLINNKKIRKDILDKFYKAITNIIKDEEYILAIVDKDN